MADLSPKDAYNQAIEAEKRLPELEPLILTDAIYIYWYAKHVVQGRWLEGEPLIIESGNAHVYAKEIIKGRWPEAESAISKNPDDAYWYALNVIKGRWFESEPIIALDSRLAYLYSKYVIKDRWLEIEQFITTTYYMNMYINLWFGDEPVVTKNEVDEFAWLRSRAEGYIAPVSWFERPVSVLDMD